jgi:hypothetical protein
VSDRPVDISTEAGSKIGLLAFKEMLRRLPLEARRNLTLGPDQLATGYRELLISAPKRGRPYFSSTRAGLAPADPLGRRAEERIAMAWFNAGSVRLADGSDVVLLDYQFPLKAKQADEGIGKIDLLGLAGGNTLVVIEIKIGGNREDRRIALIEGLVYAAIVEANAPTIHSQLETVKGHSIRQPRPHVYLAAPPEFWRRGYPSLDSIAHLAAETARIVPINIHLLSYEDSSIDLGVGGSRPTAASEIRLRPAGS